MTLFSSKKLSALLRGHLNTMLVFIILTAFILSKKNTNFNCIKNYKEIKINVVMPSEETKILEFNHYQKSDKAPFVFVQILNV